MIISANLKKKISKMQHSQEVGLDVHASDTPYVDTCAVRPGAEQNIRCTVPKRHNLTSSAFTLQKAKMAGTYFVTKRVHWHTKCPRQTEITNLQLSSFVDQKVLRFEIPM